ncbi:MAG: Neisseria PilC protein, partial [Pseudomonas sp.]|nr:Neisseria PilC protein [Pseudomonas sp.]
YLDLAVGNSLLGERLTDPMFAVGSVLFASTRTPSTDVCTPGITGWTYGLDPTTGGSTTFTVFNLSRNGTISDADNYNGKVVSAFATFAGGFFVGSMNGDDKLKNNGDEIAVDTGPNTSGRQTWRIIPSP